MAESGTLAVEPEICPVADEHRRRAEDEFRRDHPEVQWTAENRPALTRLLCQQIDPDGTRRVCHYWYGQAEVHNSNVRVDLTMLGQRLRDGARRTLPTITLCMGQRRNVPPGV